MTIIQKRGNLESLIKWLRLVVITFVISFIAITVGIILVVSTKIFHNVEDLRDVHLWNYFFDAYMGKVLFDQILGCMFLSVCVATKKIYELPDK
jgi:hypothetical protein